MVRSLSRGEALCWQVGQEEGILGFTLSYLDIALILVLSSNQYTPVPVTSTHQDVGPQDLQSKDSASSWPVTKVINVTSGCPEWESDELTLQSSGWDQGVPADWKHPRRRSDAFKLKS